MWFSTCGKDSETPECPACAKWWADNPPPAPRWYVVASRIIDAALLCTGIAAAVLFGYAVSQIVGH